MNDLDKLARIILVGLGIYVLVTQGIGIIATLPYLFYEKSPYGLYLIVRLVSFAILIAGLGLVIYLLICRADTLSEKMTDVCRSDQTIVWWLPFAFRLAMVCAGIFVLSRSISGISLTIASYAQMISRSSSKASIPWERVLGWIAQLALATYLLCGAPHFVRWQVRKTLEHCQYWEEPDDIDDDGQ
jgi:hypothetical protein